MNFQIKNTVLIVATLLTTAVFSAPAFSAEPMLSTGGYAREMHKMEMMKMLDANSDHVVTTAEFNSYYDSIFDALDSNKDGSLDAKEWVGVKGQSKLDLATGGYSRELRSMKMMKMMDTDSDHKVTKEEFSAYHKKIYDSMDTKATGQITAQEWAGKLLGGN